MNLIHMTTRMMIKKGLKFHNFVEPFKHVEFFFDEVAIYFLFIKKNIFKLNLGLNEN